MHVSALNGTKRRAAAMAIVLGLVLSLLALFTPTSAFATDEELDGSGTQSPAAAEATPPPFVTMSSAGYASTAKVTGVIAGTQSLPAGTIKLQFVSKEDASWGGGVSGANVDRATGTFSVDGVAAGSYALRLEVLSGAGDVAWTQYLNIGGTKIISIKAAVIAKLTLTVATADAQVSGNVTYTGPGLNHGAPELGASILQRIGGEWYFVKSAKVDSSSGAYVFGDIEPGEYTVSFSDVVPCPVMDPAPGFVPDQTYLDYHACGLENQWWNGKYSPKTATAFRVTAGQQITGINGTLNTNHIDVRHDRKFASDIDWMYQRKISTGSQGSNGNVYLGDAPVTREAMAAFIYRYAGRPDFNAPANPSFTDVPTTAKFYKEIEWMKSRGLTTGIKDGSKLRYAPKDSISREAMAAFLYRLAGKPAPDTAAAKTFIDVSKNQKFAKEITWMSGTGITTGWKTSQGLTYQPKEPVKRDAMAAFLHRYDTKH